MPLAPVCTRCQSCLETLDAVPLPQPLAPNASRPRLDVQALAAFGVAGAAAIAVIVSLPFSGPSPGLLASATYVLVSLMALLKLEAHHHHARFGLANFVTVVRLAGSSCFIACATQPSAMAEMNRWGVFGAAAILLALDGVDGWLARRQRLMSAFGARFDMEVDALFILALSRMAHGLGAAGPWVLGIGLLRYLFVAAGWVWPYLAAPLPFSQRRRVVCALQVIALMAALPPVVPRLWAEPLAALAFAALVWSFAVDALWLHRAKVSLPAAPR